jgi:hypothetical protein
MWVVGRPHDTVLPYVAIRDMLIMSPGGECYRSRCIQRLSQLSSPHSGDSRGDAMADTSLAPIAVGTRPIFLNPLPVDFV